MKKTEQSGAAEMTNVRPSNREEQVGKVDLSIDIPQRDYVICKVCGHKNKMSAGFCEMCSNYLFVE